MQEFADAEDQAAAIRTGDAPAVICGDAEAFGRADAGIDAKLQLQTVGGVLCGNAFVNTGAQNVCLLQMAVIDELDLHRNSFL